MGEEFIIRLFSPGDFPAVCTLEQGAKGSDYSAAVFVRQASVLFKTTFYVAVTGETVVGFAVGAPPQAATEEAWILRLRVADQYQRRSIGKNLLSTLLSAFTRMGVHRVLLTVAPGNTAARALYQGMGFRETGFFPGYFGPEEDRLIMSARLSPGNVR